MHISKVVFNGLAATCFRTNNMYPKARRTKISVDVLSFSAYETEDEALKKWLIHSILEITLRNHKNQKQCEEHKKSSSYKQPLSDNGFLSNFYNISSDYHVRTTRTI